MSKLQTPLLGYNNNVRHKGRVFHIQTEDSGVKHPHVITHLFADGGRILKTTKTAYGEQINLPNIEEHIRSIMKEQHKAMFIALRDGAFDHLIDGGEPRRAKEEASPAPPPVSAKPEAPAPAAPSGSAPAAAPSAPSAKAPEPKSKAAPAAPPPAASAPPRPSAPAPKAAPPKPAETPPPLEAKPAPASSPLRPTAEAFTGYPTHPTEPARRRPSGLPPPVLPPSARRSAPPPPLPPRRTPMVDLSAIERAAEVGAKPTFSEVHDLPPPPAAVLKRRATPGRSLTPTGTPTPAEVSTHSAGRYAVSRPSTIFATSRPQEGMSIFGEDLISEKTLDEVILSYLADDLEPGEGSR